MADDMDRLALLYSDGSLGVFAPGATRDQAEAEARESDRNEDRPEHFTAVAVVRVEIIETLGKPSLSAPTGQGDPCQTCGRK